MNNTFSLIGLIIAMIVLSGCKKESINSCNAVPTGDLLDSTTEPWTLSGLNGKIIHDISISTSTMYVTTLDDSLFRSTDNGTSWKALNVLCLNSLVSSHDSKVIVTYPRLFISQDYGESWTDRTSIFYGRVRKASVNTSVILNNIFIVGMEEDGVFISTDQGTSWYSSSSGLQSPIIYKMRVQGNYIYAATLNAIVDHVIKAGGVFVSTNNGTQWSSTGLCSDTTAIECITSSESILLAGTMDKGVFLSTDKGLNWTSIKSGLKDHYIFSLAISGNMIFAGSREGEIFISNDYGASWSTYNSGLPTTGIYSLAVNGNTIYAGTGRGMWKRTLKQ